MKVAIAIDSFKGSLSSVAAGNAAAEGVRRVFPDAVCEVRPLADGGEGTVDALVAGLGGELKSVTVTGPAGKPTVAKYGLLPGGVAVMEMAQAAGLTLVSETERNPLDTTTYGVGEMILDAIRQGAKTFVIGIGGSATNDGGAGMLQALGFRLLDAAGNDIPRGGASLAKLAKIEVPQTFNSQLSTHSLQLSTLDFKIACDVTNPLCGPNGASAVFGPQKGATPEMVATLDAALANFARAARVFKVSGVSRVASVSRDSSKPSDSSRPSDSSKASDSGRPSDSDKSSDSIDSNDPSDFSESPGVGAAGGLGFAFKAFLGAELVPGVDLILGETRLEDFVREADIVITGEGRLDRQTVMGKAPIGVARLAKKHGKRVLAFSGVLGDGVEAVNAAGVDACFPILRKLVSLEEALDVKNAAANLSATVEQAFRLISVTTAPSPSVYSHGMPASDGEGAVVTTS